MKQYIGQITVIVESEQPKHAEKRLRFLAKQLDDGFKDVIFADHNGDVEDYDQIEQECSDNAEPGLPVRFDVYEIQPCRHYRDMDDPNLSFVEPCESFEADFWTVYGHIPGEGVQAIGDFDTVGHAEEVFARITGRAYKQFTNVEAKAKP